MMANEMELIINGVNIKLPEIPGEMLAELLRDRLKLTGTKIGCSELECGACTVLVDGQAILSCTYPAIRANGKRVLTIEGLSKLTDLHELHPLQEAFINFGAVQCGFCTPGQIMAAYGLLCKTSNPSLQDIRNALKDNLCRCGGYLAIEKAILAAAQALNNGTKVVDPVIPVSMRAKKVVGHKHPRPEAKSKVTGKAIYTDDQKFDGMLYGYTKRAGVPHGRVVDINIDKSVNIKGVHCIILASDIPGAHHHGLVIQDWPTLVGIGEEVKYVGDAIALVAADTKAIAKEAADSIDITYDLLPVLSNPVIVMNQFSSKIDNPKLLKHITVSKGDVTLGLRDADIILEHTFHTGANDHAFLEPECSIARVTSDGRIEIYVGSQIPYADRLQVSQALGIPELQVRIIGTSIGGGFGGKEDITTQIHAALLAVKTARPVKILYDRQESLIVHPKRHSTEIRVKMGVKRNGKIVAIETELFGDTGAYASLGEKVMTRATTHSSGPYRVENIKANCFAVFTNNPPAGAFRGFGVTQSAFAVESMMDMAAREVEMDPVEFRMMNALQKGDITNTGQVLNESVGLLECIRKVNDEVYKLTPQTPFSSWEAVGHVDKKRAWGFAAAYKNTGLGGGSIDKAGAEIELFADGGFEVRSSSAELGQGLVTVLQLIMAEELGLDLSQVKVVLSDTDLTPDGGPTTASRQTYVTGNAVRMSAIYFKQKVQSVLSEKYDCSPDMVLLINGKINICGVSLRWGTVYDELKAVGKETKLRYDYIAPTTHILGTGGDMHFAYSFAAQAAEVEVDTITGEVKILRIISAIDVGMAVNPLGLMGQIEGGIVMGIGNALTERFIVENGYVVTDRLAKYRMPSIIQTPDIISFIVEDPTKDGPYGAKGVGEIVGIPTTPAITNAIFNAVGVRIDRLPVDQEIIARELHQRRLGYADNECKNYYLDKAQ
jgi:CO/xanthine dehydrogenase Mo-binding subunit/aerobic-type carbon monoxide dehydrogenase small subunit (CoxS/CutS family)